MKIFVTKDCGLVQFIACPFRSFLIWPPPPATTVDGRSELENAWAEPLEHSHSGMRSRNVPKIIASLCPDMALSAPDKSYNKDEKRCCFPTCLYCQLTCI